jgi:hypothetical protein
MATNQILHSLNTRIDGLEQTLTQERLVFSEQQEKSEKAFDNLEKELNDLRVRFGELKGGTDRVNLVLALLSIVLTVMIVLGGISLFKYRKFETVRQDVYDILGDVFQAQLADGIDQLIMVSPPNEQQRLANRINRTQKQLANVGVNSEEFKKQSELAIVLDLVLTNKADQALGKIDEVIQHSDGDSFVHARALALKGYLIILRDRRQCRDPDSLSRLLQRALDEDGRVAIAYNAMALCRLNEALTYRGQKDWQNYGRTMQDSVNYYRTAFELKPTATSKFRFVNNQVSAHCELFEASLKDGYPEKEFLKVTGYEDVAAFFDGSMTQLDLAKSLNSSSPAWRETKAELLSLRSSYGDGDHWTEAKRLYLEAITFGLYDKFDSCVDAFKYFIEDSYLGKLRCDKDIFSAIEKRFPNDGCVQARQALEQKTLAELCK